MKIEFYDRDLQKLHCIAIRMDRVTHCIKWILYVKLKICNIRALITYAR